MKFSHESFIEEACRFDRLLFLYGESVVCILANEIILVPRIDTEFQVNENNLKNDIETLAESINKKKWFKLSASIDKDSLKQAVDSIPKTDLPKITLDTIIDTTKLSANIQTALKAIKASESNIDVNTGKAKADVASLVSG